MMTARLRSKCPPQQDFVGHRVSLSEVEIEPVLAWLDFNAAERVPLPITRTVS